MNSCIIQYQNLKRGQIKNLQKMKIKLVNKDKKISGAGSAPEERYFGT